MLEEINALDISYRANYPLLTEHIDSVINSCHMLLSSGYSSEQEQIMNYCKIKLSHAKQLLLNDNAEDSVQLTKVTILFLLREATIEPVEEQD